MELRVIEAEKFTSNKDGGYGDYFVLDDNTGVKVQRLASGEYSFSDRNQFLSVEQAMKSEALTAAKVEANALYLAEPSGIVPKCYGLVLVKRGQFYSVGIMMEHLGNQRLTDLMPYRYDLTIEAQREREIKIQDIKRPLFEKLQACGIKHEDLHNSNVMVKDGKYYAIDFSPALFGWCEIAPNIKPQQVEAA